MAAAAWPCGRGRAPRARPDAPARTGFKGGSSASWRERPRRLRLPPGRGNGAPPGRGGGTHGPGAPLRRGRPRAAPCPAAAAPCAPRATPTRSLYMPERYLAPAGSRPPCPAPPCPCPTFPSFHPPEWLSKKAISHNTTHPDPNPQCEHHHCRGPPIPGAPRLRPARPRVHTASPAGAGAAPRFLRRLQVRWASPGPGQKEPSSSNRVWM
jgi:hypothetical protein